MRYQLTRVGPHHLYLVAASAVLLIVLARVISALRNSNLLTLFTVAVAIYVVLVTRFLNRPSSEFIEIKDGQLLLQLKNFEQAFTIEDIESINAVQRLPEWLHIGSISERLTVCLKDGSKIELPSRFQLKAQIYEVLHTETQRKYWENR